MLIESLVPSGYRYIPERPSKPATVQFPPNQPNPVEVSSPVARNTPVARYMVDSVERLYSDMARFERRIAGGEYGATEAYAQYTHQRELKASEINNVSSKSLRFRVWILIFLFQFDVGSIEDWALGMDKWYKTEERVMRLVGR